MIHNNEYSYAILIFLAIFIPTLLVLTSLKKISSKHTHKRRWLYPILRIYTPVVVLSFVIAFFIAISYINVNENIASILNNTIYSLIILISIIIVLKVALGFFLAKSWKSISKTKQLDKGLISLVNGLIYLIFILLGAVYILNIWGVEITPLLAALGIAGLAVALALQPLLSNIFSGMSIVFDGSARIGDVIMLDKDTMGTIDKIGLRSTKLRTFDNEWLIIPNNQIAESRIQNLILPEPKSRVVVPFSVAYGSNIEKVKKIVLSELEKITDFIPEPAPVVRFLEMADSSLNLKAFFHVKSFMNKFTALDEANTRIYNALNKAGITIPFPQMDVHMKKD